jgi:hypothetical protein
MVAAKRITYADGERWTVYRTSVASVPGSSDRPKRQRDQAERHDSSIARARCQVRHKGRCLGVDHLLTFTRRGGFSTLEDVWDAWARFDRLMLRRKLRSKEGAPWEYVAVPELHTGGGPNHGTWHLHVAVRGMFEVSSLRTWWHVALGAEGQLSGSDSPGNVHIKFFRGRPGGRSRVVSAYITKYVGKGFVDALSGRKSFSTSRGIAPWSVTRYHSEMDLDIRGATVRLVGELVQSGSRVGQWRVFEVSPGLEIGYFETG